MALTQSQVSQLYVSAFGRASEGDGSTYWMTNGTTMAETAQTMLDSPAAQTYFGTAYDTDQAFIEYIYQNTLGKDPSTDTDGVSYWVGRLTGGETRGTVVASMIDVLVNGDFTGDSAAVAAQNQFNNRVTVSNYCADNIASADVSDLTAFTGYISSVTEDTTTVTASQSSIDDAAALANIDGETTVLTTADDTVIGTANNDLVDGSTASTLNSGDVILDSTTTDADILNATVNSATLTSRIQNIETLNITGQYVTTGLALTNVSGATTLNLATTIDGGTATVTDVNSLNAASIVAKSSIDTLDVTSLSSGTRDTVAIDGGSASAINITGTGDSAANTYTVTVADEATVTLASFSTNDTVTLTLADDATVSSIVGLEALNIGSSTAASTVTVAAGTELAADTVVTGTQDVTIRGAAADLDDNGITETSTGTVTLSITGDATGEAYSESVVDLVNFEAANTAGIITVNYNSTVNLDADGSQTLNVGSVSTDTSFTTGTLLLNVSHNQTAVTTGAAVDSVVINATPDATADTDADGNGTAETQITIAGLTLDAAGATNAVVVQGSEDLAITLLTNPDGDEVLSASNMTGDLTLGDTTSAATIVLGSGDDTVSDTADAAVAKISAGAGDDTITVGTGDNIINGEAGDDTITGNTGADTIDGGIGNDTINGGAGVDTIATGTGSDTVLMAATQDGDTISDFTLGTDTLVLTGAAAGAVDLANQTPSAGAYDFDGTGAFNVTLTGATATDVSASVQLGTATAAFTVFNGSTTVAGAKDDYIQVATTESATLTLGGGADCVALTAGAATAATIDDFVVGTDKIILEGTAGAAVDLTALTAPTAGAYDVDGTGLFTVDLANGGTDFTATDASTFIQLGSSNAAFTMLDAVDYTGGVFDDYIAFAATTAANTLNFIDNGGMDTITGLVVGEDLLSFTGMTGISGTGAAVAANAAKLTDAQDGQVYVFADSTDGTGSEAITTFDFTSAAAIANGVTSDTVLADVAAFLEAALGESNGETYVAVINDGGNAGDSYAYLVTADDDGSIDADDISLIGAITNSAAVAITATEIA